MIKNNFKDVFMPLENELNKLAYTLNLDLIYFSKHAEVVGIAFKMVNYLKSIKVAINYNNLTDLNHHLLVKVLFFNGFFRASKTKLEIQEIESILIKNFNNKYGVSRKSLIE